jgi:hypothetical protein
LIALSVSKAALKELASRRVYAARSLPVRERLYSKLIALSLLAGLASAITYGSAKSDR